jgi:hypothetical protein
MALLNASSDYNAATLNLSSISQTKLSEASAKLAAALAPVLSAANVSALTFNPVSTPFAANHEGLDAILDRVSVDISVSGIRLNNKFAILNEDQTTSAPIILTDTKQEGSWSEGATSLSSESIKNFTRKLKKCFAVPAASRVQYTFNPGISYGLNPSSGNVYTPGSLHADCSALTATGYKSQGKVFGQAWLHLLSNPDIDETTEFGLNSQHVEDKSGMTPVWPGDKKAYVTTISLQGKSKFSYTMFETLIRNGDVISLYGNQRKFDIQVNTQFSKFDNYLNANDSVDVRIRVGLDPTLVPNASGYGVYKTTANGSKPLPQILCAWITGPLLQKNEKHNPKNPMGGILMAPPHSELTARRDYASIKIKYPEDFDPINNPIHRDVLWNDCKSSNTIGTKSEVSTLVTNNQFTLDAVKTKTDSTATFPEFSPTSLNRGTACNVPNVPGNCFPTRREYFMNNELEKAAILQSNGEPRNLMYTAYLFVDASYSESSSETAYASFGNADSFFVSAEKLNIRLLGVMPSLNKKTQEGVVVFADSVKFPNADLGVLDAYLKTGAKTIARGNSIDINWYCNTESTPSTNVTPPASPVAGIVINGYFRDQYNNRIGEAAYQDTLRITNETLIKQCPSSKTKGVKFFLAEDWYGYDPKDYQAGKFSQSPYNATSAYREIVLQTYDSKGGRIQSAYGGAQ